MTIKQYDQFLVDPAFGDVIVDAEWLKAYFTAHEALVRSHKRLQEKYDLLEVLSKRELVRLDVTV